MMGSDMVNYNIMRYATLRYNMWCATKVWSDSHTCTYIWICALSVMCDVCCQLAHRRWFHLCLQLCQQKLLVWGLACWFLRSVPFPLGVGHAWPRQACFWIGLLTVALKQVDVGLAGRFLWRSVHDLHHFWKVCQNRLVSSDKQHWHKHVSF